MGVDSIHSVELTRGEIWEISLTSQKIVHNAT